MDDFAAFERVLYALPDGRKHAEATKQWLEKVDPEDKPDCLRMAWTLFVVPDVSQELVDLKEFRARDVVKMAKLSSRMAKADDPTIAARDELTALSTRLDWLDGEITKIQAALDAWPSVSSDRCSALASKYGLPGLTSVLPPLPRIPAAEPQARATNPFASFDKVLEIAAQRIQAGAPGPGVKPPRERYFRKLLGDEAGKAYARVAYDTMFDPVGRNYSDRLLRWLKGIKPTHRQAALAASELCRQLDELRRAEAKIQRSIRERAKIIDDPTTRPGLQEGLAMENSLAEELLRTILGPVDALEEAILKLGHIMEQYGQPPQYDPLPTPAKDSDTL